MEIVFKNTYYLWALLVIPLIIVVHFLSLRYSGKRALKFANFVALARVSEKIGVTGNYSILGIRVLVLVFFIFAIAGTSIWYMGSRAETDFVIAIDSSSSMLANDLNPSRIEVAKESAINFVEKLNPIYNSAGFISFSGTPFVHQVLTKNKQFLKDAVSNIEISKIGGTDIGNAIVTGSNILISSDKPKVVILITDGRSNIGMDINDAIEYANNNNVMVYSFGIGTEEGFFEGNNSKIGPLGINEEELKEIADSTKGKYFNIRSNSDFENAYSEILKIEKRKVSLDLSLFLLLAGLVLLSLEWVLINTRFRIIP